MDDSATHCRRHRLHTVLHSIRRFSRELRLRVVHGAATAVHHVRRYRKALLLRVAYGAATATGTTAAGLIALVVQRHL